MNKSTLKNKHKDKNEELSLRPDYVWSVDRIDYEDGSVIRHQGLNTTLVDTVTFTDLSGQGPSNVVSQVEDVKSIFENGDFYDFERTRSLETYFGLHLENEVKIKEASFSFTGYAFETYSVDGGGDGMVTVSLHAYADDGVFDFKSEGLESQGSSLVSFHSFPISDSGEMTMQMDAKILNKIASKTDDINLVMRVVDHSWSAADLVENANTYDQVHVSNPNFNFLL